MEMREMLNAEIARMKKGLKRLNSLFVTVGNCKELLEHIGELKEAEKPIPDEVKFGSYDDWEKAIDKKRAIALKAIERLDKFKELIKVYEFYLEKQATQD